MNRLAPLLLLTLGTLQAQTGFPFAGESLGYTVNWPSGLGLGEGRMEARRAGQRWEFQFTLQAGIPGFAIQDTYRSIASDGICSLEFEKDAVHGRRKIRERTVFDTGNGLAVRTTINGGKTEIPIGQCTRDALAFLYYVRRELGQGRMPAPQAVLFGATYDIRLEYGGGQPVTLHDRKVEADRLTASVRGPSSDHGFEIFFARDAARTPLLVRVPLAAGTFSLELIR
ncbi:MAG: DUF3108 domain-containing protein [Bryobacterales bacterium]|nr:DUF3108 domain-containing protein [Bryobacterales bacterium]